MESVESRAKEALEAYLKCNETVKSVYYKKICDHDCDNCNLNYAQGTYGDHKEAVKTAIQALEKQMPKKPDFTEDKEFALCPCCNGKGLLDKQKYCDNCGQKLDWGDEE